MKRFPRIPVCFSAIPGLFLPMVLLAAVTASAHPISRSAAEAIATSWIASSPYAAEAVGYRFHEAVDSTLDLGDVIAPLDSSEVYPITAPTWFFWVDNQPTFWFIHSTTALLVNANTGSIVAREWGFFPIVNDSTVWGTAAARADTAAIFYGLDHAPPPPAPSRPGFKPDLDRLSPLAGGNCAILINASTVPAGDADVDTMASVLQSSGRVPMANIMKLKNPDWAAICTAIMNANNCKKMYFHWSGHGDPKKGVYVEKDDKWHSWKDLICKYWMTSAANICIHQESCHSGNLVDAQLDKMIDGIVNNTPFKNPDISTTADNCHIAPFADGVNVEDAGGNVIPVGSCNTMNFAKCLMDSVADGAGGKRLRTWKEAHEWAKMVLKKASWGDGFGAGGDRGARYWLVANPLAPAPVIEEEIPGLAQDSFSSDGTLNPAAPGRIDLNRTNGEGPSGPHTAHGDSMVVNGDAGNTRVFVRFKITPGIFTNTANFLPWYFSHPTDANGYHYAQMDTAQGPMGMPETGLWMTTYHESDPHFSGTDTSIGPDGGLANDIFPDNLFTPGTQMMYFFEASYYPGDFRNPGGTAVYRYPADSDFPWNVLPMVEQDTTWACALLVEPASQMPSALDLALGPLPHDTYRIQHPEWDCGGLGRPLGTVYGASLTQLIGYRNLILNYTRPSMSFFNGFQSIRPEDGDLLHGWATNGASFGVAQRVYALGGGLAVKATADGGQLGAFVNNWLGTQVRCDDVSQSNCPSGSPGDASACFNLPTSPGAHFPTLPTIAAKGPGFGDRPVLRATPTVTTARANLNYSLPFKGLINAASISNLITTGANFRSVFDVVALEELADPGSGCTTNNSAFQIRLNSVMNWLGILPGFCGIPPGVSDVPPSPEKPPVTTLIGASPSPLTHRSFIYYRLARMEQVSIVLFDVTGRRVRQLIDRVEPGGEDRAAMWDGRDDEGRYVPSGLYFYQLSTESGEVRSNRLAVVR